MLSIGVLTVIGVAGLAVLLFLLIFDDIFDIFGGEPVLPAGAVFTAIFGFSGAIATTLTEGESPALLAIPLTVAALAAGLFFFAYRSLKRMADRDEGQTVSADSLVGSTAVVDYWHGTSGEVVVVLGGHTRRLRAISTEPLNAEQTVHVLSALGDTLTVGTKAISS